MSYSAFMDDRRDRPSFDVSAYAAPDAPSGDGHGALTAQAAWHTSAVLFTLTGLACLVQIATGLFDHAVKDSEVIAIAAVYAQEAMGFTTRDSIVLILAVNVTAALGAFAFGHAS